MTEDGSAAPGPTALGSMAARAFGWSFLNTALSRLGTMVVGIALARLLGPDEFGTFAVALVALLAVLSFNELGVSLAVVRWEGEPDDIIGTVNAISTAGSLLLCAAMWVCATPVARLLGAPDAAGIIALMSVSIVFSGLVAGPAALLQRQFRQRRRLVIDQVVTWSGTAVSLALAVGGLGAWSLAWGRVAGTLIGVVLFVHATRPYELHVRRSMVAPLLRFGLPLAGASILVFAAGYVEQVVVGATLGATSLGFFVLAFNLASWPVTMFSQPLRGVAPAVFARIQHDRARMSDTFAGILAVLAAMTLPVCLVAAAAAPDIVRLVYGEPWAPAGPVFQVLVLVAVLRIFFELSYDFLVVLQRTSRLLVIQAVWLVVATPAAVFAAPRFGIVGVAVAQLVVTLVVVLPLYLGLVVRAGVHPAALARAVLLPGVVALGAAGATLLLGEELSSAWAAAPAAALVCLAAVAMLAVPQRARMRALLTRRTVAEEVAV